MLEFFATSPTAVYSDRICGPMQDKNKPPIYCEPGLACVAGECKRGDFVDDININDAQSLCSYSGKGIKSDCKWATVGPSKCGVQNNFTRCEPGMFCSASGECTWDKPNMSSQNCLLYSGVGIKDCARQVSSDNNCGLFVREPNDTPKHRICSAGKYCAAVQRGRTTVVGECVADEKFLGNTRTTPKYKEMCDRYSGEGIVGCASGKKGAGVADAAAPAPYPGYVVRQNMYLPEKAMPRVKATTVDRDRCASDCIANKCAAFVHDSANCYIHPAFSRGFDAGTIENNKLSRNGAVLGYRSG